MGAELTPELAKKETDDSLVFHMNQYRSDSGVWQAAANELAIRQRIRIVIWSTAISSIVTIAVNLLLKLLVTHKAQPVSQWG